MRRYKFRSYAFISFAFISVILSVLLSKTAVFASDDKSAYTNPDTGYEVYIDDSEGLLSEIEKETVVEEMKSFTKFGNAVFVSANLKPGQAERYAASYYENTFGGENGAIFLVDMGDRLLVLQGHQDIDRLLTSSKCNSIMDNVYRYAGSQAYDRCVITVFDQAEAVVQEQHIAQPFKYITNIFLSVILAFLIGFIVLGITMAKPAPTRKEILNGLFSGCNITDRAVVLEKVDKLYSPISSGSSGGSGGSHHSSSHHSSSHHSSSSHRSSSHRSSSHRSSHHSSGSHHF